MRLVSPLPPRWLTVFILFALLLSTSTARAEEERPGYGQLVVYLFDVNGLPIEGFRVRLDDGTSCATDAEGFCTLEARAGEVTISIEREGDIGTPASRPIPIAEGRSTEIIITYNRAVGATAAVDVEAPRGEGLVTVTATATGRIEGTVKNEKGEPVEEARIFVRGSPLDARTDAEGRFVLDGVPAEPVDLTVIHPNYGTTSKNQVPVLQDETTTVAIEVLASVGSLGEFVVTIPKLEGGAVEVLAERRESSNVADLLGADQIAKSGDSDAASALQRVTGITLVGGRYIYVRGLGERYSSTLLDGSTLPSPDPERRVVPLDLFPSSILGSIVVQKTYSPDLPGEFGGGAVNLRTKDVPEELNISISASLGYRTGTTFDTALGYEGTSTDFLGFGTSGRAPEGAFKDAIDAGEIRSLDFQGNGFTREQLRDFALDLNNDFGLTQRTVAPDVGLGFTIGGKTKMGDKSLGAILGLTYGNTWFAKESVFNSFSSSGESDLDFRLRPNLQVRLLDLVNEVNLGGLGIISFDWDDKNRFRLTASLNRIAENSSRLQYGDTIENITRLNRLRWIEQQLVTAQIRGEQEDLFSTRLRLDWRYMFSTAGRDEPDRRRVAYSIDTTNRAGSFLRDRYLIDTQDILNQRFFQDLTDINHDLALDLTYPLQLFGDVETKLRAGGGAIIKARTVDTRRFAYVSGGGDLRPVRDAPPDQIFGPDTLTGERAVFVISEVTEPNDSYEAEQELFAGYIMGDVGFTETLRLLIGARAETSRQLAETFSPGRTGDPNETGDLDTFDILPAATLTWGFAENMQLRLAGSRTLSRPTFRELSPSVFRDLGGTVAYQGNPDLERTLITNADLRYEWYPSAGESFSVSLFYKDFVDPVELTAVDGAVTLFEPFNLPQAIAMGAEVESRVEFGFIDRLLEAMYFAGNLTLVYSEINFPEGFDRGTITSVSRPLAGQSPWVINTQLGYDDPEIGVSASLLYNIFGPRIYAIGRNNAPDIYEQPFDQLDFVLNWRLGRVKLSGRFQNILDPVARATQESISENVEFPVYSFRRGRRVTVGVSVDLN